MKTCPRCKETLPLDAFNNCSSNNDGKGDYCRVCYGKIQREWRLRNPEKVKERANEYYKRNMEKNRGKQPDPTIRKRCGVCKLEKPGSAFLVDRGTVDCLSRRCRQCSAEASLASYHKYPGKKRDKHLRSRYNLSIEKFDELLRGQGGNCAICGDLKKLVVDHCHVTGAVRGVLCSHCNVGLGRFKDNQHLLRRAADYLDAKMG